MADPKNRLKNLRKRIEDAEGTDTPSETGAFKDGNRREQAVKGATVILYKRDRDILLDFDDRLSLVRENIGFYRHSKLLRHNYILARDTEHSVAEALEDREVAEDLVRWIHRNKSKEDSEETNRDFRVALRQLGKRVTDGDGVPDTLSWISAKTSSNYDPRPDPSEMISYNEMERLVDASQNPRDAAMVAVAWDAGCRSGEFRDLTVGDVADHDHGLQIRLDGKTGQRSVTLIPSVPRLRLWLNHHPGKDDPSAPLWSKLNEAEEMSYRSLKDAFERLADRAERFSRDRKPVTLTNFRKSRASNLASRGMSQAHLEKRMGWVQGSSVASRYIRVFGDEADDEFARLEGVEVSDEKKEEHAPVQCPRCQKESPRGEPVCMWCGQALDPVASEEIDEFEDVLWETFKLAAEGEIDLSPEMVEKLKQSESKPSVRRNFVD